jgi:hypothetical protein
MPNLQDINIITINYFLYKMPVESSITFRKSRKKGKKYDAIIPAKLWNKYRTPLANRDKIISFGALGYQHYKDLIGSYSKLDHLDKYRRRLYRARHAAIFQANSRTPSYQIRYTPAWFSWRYLW